MPILYSLVKFVRMTSPWDAWKADMETDFEEDSFEDEYEPEQEEKMKRRPGVDK